METKDVISFFNYFPGVKAELVAATGIKITSVYFMGHVLYETGTGNIDISNVKGDSDVIDDFKALAQFNKKQGIPPATLLTAMFERSMIKELLGKMDNSKVLVLPF